jgi:flagellar export protein FliJ
MPFRYTLDPVLKLRASFERLERNRLLLISAALTRVRESLEFLARDADAAHHSMLAKLASGVASGELELDRLLRQALQDRRRVLQSREAELVTHQQKQQRAYLAAKMRREILEDLRDQRLAQYNSDQLRREQQRLDELFLMRRRHSSQSHSE